MNKSRGMSIHAVLIQEWRDNVFKNASFINSSFIFGKI